MPTRSRSMTMRAWCKLGSDWGVFPFEPLLAIYCAVTRMTPEGAPPGGWYPAGRVSVEAALWHFARDGAYASFDEGVRGTLTPGKLADFSPLKRHPDHSPVGNS